jgi:FtsP/CotA-like multicopper oxidase with cupredoxin domain
VVERFPVQPAETDALLVGMGERCDVLVTLRDGVFPLVASAEGKHGQGIAVVRTAAGTPPQASARPSELDGPVVTATDLATTPDARLPDRAADRRHHLVLSGSMAPYRWTLNGKTLEDADPLDVHQGERVQLRFRNMSMMFHPMHVHGHTFAVNANGVRKDTVIVRPMQTVVADLDANKPGSVGDSLPQRLPRRGGHDDDPLVPHLAASRRLGKLLEYLWGVCGWIR